jgi:magnesium and cobalt transporter
MGSSNDGSEAALGAGGGPTENGQRGFLSRIFSALSSSEPAPDPNQADLAPAAISAPSVPGIGNLRRLRVDDVAIPKVEITAVPVDIGKNGEPHRASLTG